MLVFVKNNKLKPSLHLVDRYKKGRGVRKFGPAVLKWKTNTVQMKVTDCVPWSSMKSTSMDYQAILR